MDKIREEFEKENIVYAYITFDKIHNCYIPTNPTDVKGWQEEDIRDMNIWFPRYKKGYKSRDEAFQKLETDCKNLVEVNNNQSEIVEGLKAENKKQLEALEDVVEIRKIYEEVESEYIYLMGELTKKIETLIHEAKQALKDGD